MHTSGHHKLFLCGCLSVQSQTCQVHVLAAPKLCADTERMWPHQDGRGPTECCINVWPDLAIQRSHELNVQAPGALIPAEPPQMSAETQRNSSSTSSLCSSTDNRQQRAQAPGISDKALTPANPEHLCYAGDTSVLRGVKVIKRIAQILWHWATPEFDSASKSNATWILVPLRGRAQLLLCPGSFH